IEFAGTLVEQVHGKVGAPLLSGRIERSAAVELKVHGDQRKRVILDQPGGDPSGTPDLDDSARPRVPREKRPGKQEGQHRARDRARQDRSAGGSTGAPPAPSLSPWRATAITSSGVTAPMRSGQAWTSSRLRPVTSEAPMMRATPERLSRA